MKIYCVNLKRSTDRRKFMEHQFRKLGLDVEFIEAVDGRNFDDETFRQLTDATAVKYSPQWITRGAVGCVLSHRLCYQKLIESGDRYALILEDDVVIEKSAVNILNRMGDSLGTNEVLLLYFQSFKNILISEKDPVAIDERYRLMYPVNFENLGSTGGYFITADAAKNLYENTLPVRVSADSWGDFVKWGYLHRVRLVIPFAARSAYYESAIDYLGKASFLTRLKSFISQTRLFPFFQLLKLRRQRSWKKMTRYELTSRLSPLQSSQA